jgi:hypothetical protein
MINNIKYYDWNLYNITLNYVNSKYYNLSYKNIEVKIELYHARIHLSIYNDNSIISIYIFDNLKELLEFLKRYKVFMTYIDTNLDFILKKIEDCLTLNH